MATSTKIPLEYRTNYYKNNVPADVMKQMQREITYMKHNLIKKQKRLINNENYNTDPEVLEYLKNIEYSKNSIKATQNTWNRLYNMEQSNFYSVRGRQKIAKQRMESLMATKDFDLSGGGLPAKDYYKFLNQIEEEYGTTVISSDEVVDYYYEHRKEVNSIEEMVRKFRREIK